MHLTLEALTTGVGVARLEGAGPITVPAASDFLRHCHVTILPVLDLDGPQPVDGYEVPTRIGNAVRILVPYESFPWSTRSSRGAELDHTRRYLPPNRGGPPKQTRLDNLGPLTRRRHRLKTHSPGWHVTQPAPGVYLWRTPTGYWTRVDATGTHWLGRQEESTD